MNIKIIDGYVTFDGTIRVSVSHKLFTNEGMDICMPKEKQPAPADPRHESDVRFATTRDVTRRIWGLLEDLEKRFDARAEKIWNLGIKNESARIFSELGAELHAEKECWK